MVLCFSLILLGLTTPSVFASAHTQHTAATVTDVSSQFRLKGAIELGTFDFGGIAMVNAQVGWTFTSTLQRTSDGGQTWQTVAQGNDQEGMGQVEVLDAQTAWYLTFDKQTFATTALYRTNDGGQTWTRFPWIDPAQQLVNISLFSGQFAWVATADYSGDSPVHHLYLVGGSSQTWQEVKEPAQNGANSISFISQQVGWATVVTEGDFNQSWALYMTRDGGQTWTQQNLVAPAGVPAGAIVTNIRFLGFGDQQEGYLTASFGDSASYTQYSRSVYRTQDGGQTWHSYGDAQPNGFIVQVDRWHITFFFLATLVDGGENLLTLSDGRWKSHHITLPASALLLSVLNNSVMFISGFNSDNSAQILYRSSDGGASWQQVATVPIS